MGTVSLQIQGEVVPGLQRGHPCLRVPPAAKPSGLAWWAEAPPSVPAAPTCHGTWERKDGAHVWPPETPSEELPGPGKMKQTLRPLPE